MVDLRVELRRLRLRNPVIAAAGTFGFGEEYAELYDLSILGALVTKTLTVRPRPGNPQPRLWETPCGLLNSIGLENPGLDAFLEDVLPRILNLGVPIVVSVYGDTPEEYGAMACRIPAGVAALELNLSCPNVPGKPSILSRPEIAARVAAAREAWPAELWAKISPEGDHLAAALAAQEAGADAIVAANTFRGMAIDLSRRAPVFANVVAGLSGPAIKP
ncbi:MAG: dihydroorotate dehydrogenase, partial [Candidatus Bipolaricaulaceae bacterium]